MTETSHRELRELLGWYALGRAVAAERTRVEAHLDGCPDCRAELRLLRATLDRLALVDVDRLADTVSPPADLGDRVVAAVAAQRRGQQRPRMMLLAAAAAVVLLVGGAVGWLVRPVPAVPAAVPLEPVAVQVQTAGIDASANLVNHTWGVEIQMVATGFTSGEAYQVRMLTRSGEQPSAGEFVGVGATSMKCNLNSSVLRAEAVGFEVLDPSGAIVLSSNF